MRRGAFVWLFREEGEIFFRGDPGVKRKERFEATEGFQGEFRELEEDN